MKRTLSSQQLNNWAFSLKYVNLKNRNVHFYNEFECGGVLSKYDIDIPDDIDINDETDFIKWLDEYIPDEND